MAGDHDAEAALGQVAGDIRLVVHQVDPDTAQPEFFRVPYRLCPGACVVVAAHGGERRQLAQGV
ncbi:hypothetical protein D3C76_1753430 [compost metagenome]